MPENPAEAAIEAVDKALEVAEDADKKKPGPPDNWAKMRQLTTFIASIAALLTAIGALIKSCDHSVTENAYATLSKGMQEVQKATEQNHQDLQSLHDYLTAAANGEDMDGDGTERADISPMDAGVLAQLLGQSDIQFVPPTAASGFAASRQAFLNATPRDAGVAQLTPLVRPPPKAPPPPPVHPVPSTWVAKTWSDVEKGI